MVKEDMLALGRHRSVIREIFEYGNRRKAELGADKVFDFSLGNPSIPAPPAVNAAIRELTETEDSAVLHGYTSAAGAPQTREAVADYIRRSFDFPADAAHVYMTAGAAASLTATLTALVGAGDEVITLAPFFPEYKVFIERTGAVMRPVMCRAGDFQADIAALDAAVCERTAAIIVNSPNNPTGAVLDEENIRALAALLREKAAAFGHPIYLIADEPYRELVYDGVSVPYIPRYYADTVVCYSFSKSLSLAGERIGYIFVSPLATDADAVFDAVCGAGRALGFVCAPSLFQRVIARCIGQTADISVYDRNRRRLYAALCELGFTVVPPRGAFYLFVQAPDGDAAAFCELAKTEELLLVPSEDFYCEGYVRIAYCVTPAQIEAAIPAFRRLAKKCDLKERK